MNQTPKTFNSKAKYYSPWLDALAILAWGALLLKYSLTGQLKLLIHPNYFWLVFVTGIILLSLGIIKANQILKSKSNSREIKSTKAIEHITLFPPGWSSTLLVTTAVLGFLIHPTILNSEAALHRGVTESLPLVRSQPQSFRTNTNPENRSLLDWIRTVSAYPEPDAYTGQTAKVTGFVIHLPSLPDNYLLVSRFVVTCCAVDAYPVGIPVKLNTSRAAYPPDTWIEVEGKMTTETLAIDRANLTPNSHQQRQLVLNSTSIKKIPTPSDPYAY
jgi:uncharacterized repeat protein (TIGR03943 family)